jgi:diguanylate cyclase
LHPSSLFPELIDQIQAMTTFSPDFTTVSFVGKLADSVNQAHSLETLVRPLLELLEATTGLESTYLTRVDRDAGVQHILFARNTSQLDIPEGLSVPWEGTLCRRALEEGVSYTDDVANLWADSEPAKVLGISTYASTAIHTNDGALYGTLCAASDHRKPLSDGAAKVLQMFSQLIAFQVDRERLMQALREANSALAASALTDVTTLLPNRRALMDALRHRLASAAVANRVPLIAFIDLDHFKAINDQHGHDVGDRFLAAIGRRLQSAVRSDDFVARLGGDEFVVLAESSPEEAQSQVEQLHSRLQSASTGKFHFADLMIDYAGPSIGVIASPSDSSDPEALLRQADAAMYAIKRSRHVSCRPMPESLARLA